MTTPQDISTWHKAKDALLILIAGILASVLGFVAMQIGADISKTRTDLAEIKIGLSIFQANATSMEKRVSKVESWTEEHSREDRESYVRRIGLK